jgi:hypothetical protein
MPRQLFGLHRPCDREWIQELLGTSRIADSSCQFTHRRDHWGNNLRGASFSQHMNPKPVCSKPNRTSERKEGPRLHRDASPSHEDIKKK